MAGTGRTVGAPDHRVQDRAEADPAHRCAAAGRRPTGPPSCVAAREDPTTRTVRCGRSPRVRVEPTRP